MSREQSNSLALGVMLSGFVGALFSHALGYKVKGISVVRP